jgi:hypothetical protein
MGLTIIFIPLETHGGHRTRETYATPSQECTAFVLNVATKLTKAEETLLFCVLLANYLDLDDGPKQLKIEALRY